jgi:membrane-associated protease RseP (regulator of RpoE activity)
LENLVESEGASQPFRTTARGRTWCGQLANFFFIYRNKLIETGVKDKKNTFHKYLSFGGIMIRKSLIFIMLATFACAVFVSAQTPKVKQDGEKAPKVFSFAFDDDGGYLGIQTAEVTKENFGKYGLRDVRGVAVEKVLDNSPAQTAGLQNGDVITRFNGEEITSVRKLTRLVNEVAPDHQARVTVARGGDERELTVTVGKRPMPSLENGNFEFRTDVPGKVELPDMPMLPRIGDLSKIRIAPGAEGDTFVWRTGSSRQIGVSVSPLTKQLAEYFGVSEGGLLVDNVRDNSPAAKAGLKAGDVITEVDGKPVKGDLDLIHAIGAKKEGDVELTVMRDRNRQTFRVTPEESKGSLKPMIESFGGEGFNRPDPLIKIAPAMPAPMSVPFVIGRGSRIL